jgi:hypothetical protein
MQRALIWDAAQEKKHSHSRSYDEHFRRSDAPKSRMRCTRGTCSDFPRICLRAAKRDSARLEGRLQSLGEAERQSRHRENFFKPPPLGKLIMNTKSVLIATLLAAVSSVAFAADVTNVAPVAAQAETVQLAQANTGARNMAPSARAGSNAVSANCANTYNEATSMIVCNNHDGRTRAQVREETRAWLNSAEGKASRSVYFGGAQ